MVLEVYGRRSVLTEFYAFKIAVRSMLNLGYDAHYLGTVSMNWEY